MQNKPEKPPIPKPPAPPKRIPGLKTNSSDEKKYSETEKKPTANKIRTVANVMMFGGFLTMTFTLFGYETTICETTSYGTEYDCVYNTGKIGKKNDWMLFGGFMFLGGCILLNNEECRK